ncbi:O-antigen polymerase [Desulfobulbus propionicus DSM 2032]|uniref:O-antigen polymerase n=1 Tax=Desulfobulbus propionicus (strain ATCC 33891 / DSM 2032 / VKM B-1956 / 1pr3) TaxID=577650 RepID=A0A7U3YJG9_DESPD|nr:O-antigen ligase family protein [Desulfobulbus propionicus]ADW16533.1 O-antigen polymerase [Desulfobulbus propionicus DSM 2032]
MRVILLKILFPILSLFSFVNPFYGVINYTFISVIRPEQLTYGSPIIGNVFALAIGCLFIACITKKEKLIFAISNKFFVSFLLFVIFLYVSTYFSPFTDFTETRGSIYYLQQFPQIFVFCLCLYAVLTRLTKKEVQFYLYILTFLFLFMGLWGIEQYFRGNTLVENLFGTAIVDRCGITAVFILYFPISLYLFISNKGFKKIFGLISSITFMVMIILTQSRAGFLGFLMTLFVLWLHSKQKIKLLLISFVFVIPVLFILPNEYISRIKTIKYDSVKNEEILDLSAASRIVLWKIALKIFQDNPVAGIGNLNFSKAGIIYHSDFIGKINEDLYEYIFDHKTIKLSHSHNTFINILAEGGLIATIPFFIVLFLPIVNGHFLIKKYINKENDYAKLLLYINSGLIGFYVAAIFANLLLLDFLYWNLTLSYFIGNKIYNDSEL